jgi:predicted kinase
MKLKNTLIYLLGVPAVGKYTTARAIERACGARVIDNQLVNNPIFTVIGYDGTDKFNVSKEAWNHIERIRREVLRFIGDHAQPDASFVFTNVLADAPGDRRLFRKLERIAKHRGGRFFPVWLTCDVEELRKRKNRQDRRDRLKDTDLTNIKYWLEEFQQIKIDHPNALKLDTTMSKPDETAAAILRHVRRRRRQ